MFDLKPCPFCGGEAILETVDGNGSEECYIYCPECDFESGVYSEPKFIIKSGTGGLTMATKRVCDRCGAEINPFNSVTYAGMRRVKNEINDNDYELCVSCAHKLRKWFNGEENDNG